MSGICGWVGEADSTILQAASRGLFRREYLEELLAHRLGGLHPRHGIKIWLLLTLESWLRTVFDEG